MLTRTLQARSRRAAAQAGDTLIEVILAIAVFSIIVVSAIAMMNQGSAASQRALEITLARQAVDAQADTLRYLQASYVQNYYSGITFNLTDGSTSPAEEFYRAIQKSTTQASQFGSTPCGNPPASSFVLNPRTATTITNHTIFKDPATYPQQHFNGSNLTASDGLWVEGVRAAQSGNTGYIDFHIRACWSSPGSAQPMNIGTIVRLYEPRG